MDMVAIGNAIKRAREKRGYTQEKLAELVGVSVQAVSKWENGKNLPDLENLMLICEITDTPYQAILTPEQRPEYGEEISIRTRLFHENNMYTRLKSYATAENLTETYKALHYMRKQHLGLFRKKAKYADELVQYINHPLMMACQAHAFGIRDDALLSAILLHDVVEDTGVTLEEIPFSDEVKKIVGLLTFTETGLKSWGEEKKEYYSRIKESGKACVVKCIDRCNNVSTMAGSFTKKRMLEYIDETERYILPLADVLKNEYPEYNDLAFLLKYHIISIIETIKNLIIE